MNPDSLPKLSVIVIVRNGVKTIARALDSLIAQHYPNMEVIVWDGLSTDGTLEVLKGYSHLITTLRSERDNGPPDAYNKAMALATGEYVGFLNADDQFEPGAFWTVADALQKHPDAEAITFGMFYSMFDKKGHQTVKGYYADERQLAVTLDYVLSENQTFQLSRFHSRDLLRELGDFNIDRNLWYLSCDREYMTRMALRGCRNVIIPKALYTFTVDKNSLSSNPDNYSRIIEEHALIAEMLLKKKDLSGEQRAIIINWQMRQLVFGFWQAIFSIRIDKAESFAKQGFIIGKWKFILLLFILLIQKMIKRIALKLSNGIDRGQVRACGKRLFF